MRVRKTVIPFGPQHPVLPEPLQLNLSLDGPNVKELLPALGYVHRGIEKACERQDFHQNVFLVERVCGICSSIHGLAYCLAIEKLLGCDVPPRASYLRVVWSELHRIHSHLLWLGLMAEAFGFESLFMEIWRIRESVMDILERTAGNRVIISVTEIGGVRRDLSIEDVEFVRESLDHVEHDFNKVLTTLMDDYTLKKRTVGKGQVDGKKALELGAVGPDVRASGVMQDARMTGYCCYGELGFEPITAKEGDVHARCVVRTQEVFQSIELVRRALRQLPDGPISSKPRGNPHGRAMVRVEAPRGELTYFVVGNGSKNLERTRIRVPTLANVPMMLSILQGCEFTDLAVIAISIDPCMSCTER